MNSKEAGLLGEELSCRLLLNKGYEIVKRNFRFGHGEIDIVARHDGYLVFVEVKTRQNDEWGPPEAAITLTKQKQIIRIARAYLYVNGISEAECRFDVIAVSLADPEKPQLTHFENAFIDM